MVLFAKTAWWERILALVSRFDTCSTYANCSVHQLRCWRSCHRSAARTVELIVRCLSPFICISLKILFISKRGSDKLIRCKCNRAWSRNYSSVFCAQSAYMRESKKSRDYFKCTKRRIWINRAVGLLLRDRLPSTCALAGMLVQASMFLPCTWECVLAICI